MESILLKINIHHKPQDLRWPARRVKEHRGGWHHQAHVGPGEASSCNLQQAHTRYQGQANRAPSIMAGIID